MIPALNVSSASTSRVRTHESADAGRRLRAFLSSIAPLDEAALDALATTLLREARSDRPELVIAHAQRRIDAWAERALGPDARSADPEGVELRRALDRHPELLLSDERADHARLRDVHRELLAQDGLPTQALDRPRRLWMLALVPGLAAGGFGAWLFADAVGESWLTPWWSALFGLLVSLHAHALVLGLLGCIRRMRGVRFDEATGPLPRTAIVMPVYEEDPERVFAALAAMRERLLAHPEAEAFEIFVASDTQQPERAADEARAWRRLASHAARDGRVPVFYRRRRRNVGKKAGNLAELFVRHADRYRYAIVLDADSLVGAETMIRLVRRMEASPRLGLLQAPIALRAGETLFARALQFAHVLAGGVLTSGLAAWSGPDGNYFGHNAIVRVDAFVRCCGLPLLSGAPPLGGPILSHDFVEAALLRRGGFEVRLADDLDDSFEEPPPTLHDYLVRDRRWCQGNLQHLRVVLADGLVARSRVHLLLGALAYLLSPLWLLFLGLGALAMWVSPPADPAALFPLGLAALALLLAPRLLGLLLALRSRQLFGGVLRLVAGTALELFVSCLLAPITMLAHTLFVVEIVTGRAVGWAPQRRRASGAWSTALDARTILATLLGALAIGLAAITPTMLWLVLPIALPWLLAIPFAALLASEPVGRALATSGLLRTPEEHAPSAVVRALEAQRGYFHADATARFRDLVLDPSLCARWRASLSDEGEHDDALVTRAIEVGPAGLSEDERRRLLASREALELLHREAWRHWNVEDWELPRGVRAEPSFD